MNRSKVLRVEALDELAAVLFPGNKNHQRIFLAIFVELKWAEGQFLTTLDFVGKKHVFNYRSLETVRAKMRRLGLIDHVSRFNQKHGYREGWTFSGKFSSSLGHLAETAKHLTDASKHTQEPKDRDLLRYI